MHNFTYSEYVTFVAEARARGYELAGFDKDPPTDGALLLRHDIDTDLGSAVQLAELEQQHDIRASYFVLLTSPLYNPFSTVGRIALASILAAGHTIGLHHDPTVPDAYLDDECDQLETILDRPVDAISFHKPDPLLIGAPGLPGFRRHTYEPPFVTAIDYCSDSTGQWRFGPPNERDSYRDGRSMQLLTHPDWWDTTPSTAWGRRAQALSRIGYAIRDLAEADLGAA